MQTRPRTGALITPTGIIEPGKLYSTAELTALGVQPIGTRVALSSGGEAISDGAQWNRLEYVNGSLVLNGGVIAGINSVTASLAASQNDYAPTGYVAGETNFLNLTAASGGSTITGILAGAAMLFLWNASTTDSITFPHQSGSSQAANQFSCPGGSPNTLGPLTGCRVMRVNNKWGFFS